MLWIWHPELCGTTKSWWTWVHWQRLTWFRRKRKSPAATAVTANSPIDQLQDRIEKRIISNEGDPGLRLARLDLIEPVRQPDQDAPPPLTDAIRFALENRIEMRQAEYDIQNQEISVQFTKNQKLPVLDISAGYVPGWRNSERRSVPARLGSGSEIVRVVPGGPRAMFRQLFSYKYPDYTAGFTLEIPLSNTAAKADYERSLTERELAINRRDALAQRIALEVRNAYSQVEMNRAEAATGRRVYNLAREKLDAERAKFDLGISTIRFVLEEQRSVAQARTDEIEALVKNTRRRSSHSIALREPRYPRTKLISNRNCRDRSPCAIDVAGSAPGSRDAECRPLGVVKKQYLLCVARNTHIGTSVRSANGPGFEERGRSNAHSL